MKLPNLYTERCARPSDIVDHLPALAALAAQCLTVAEFGVRGGNSTIALLFGLSPFGPERASWGQPHLYSYDKDPCRETRQIIEAAITSTGSTIEWTFGQADTAQVEIPLVDMLFVDTLHTYAHVLAELRPSVLAQVRTYLAFHDTILFGGHDEGSRGPGILPAILERLGADGGWVLHSHNSACNGLTVFERV